MKMPDMWFVDVNEHSLRLLRKLYPSNINFGDDAVEVAYTKSWGNPFSNMSTRGWHESNGYEKVTLERVIKNALNLNSREEKVIVTKKNVEVCEVDFSTENYVVIDGITYQKLS